MRRTGAVAILLLALAGAAPAAVSDHLDASPQVRLHGTSHVQGGVHFSPVQDPWHGAWHGVVNWHVGCPGAERWAWEVEFSDLASGSYGVPADRVPRKRSTSVFFFDASGFSTRPAESRPVIIPAGAFVFPHIEGRCFGDSHWSEPVHQDGEPLYVPAYVWYPTIATVSGRKLQSRSAGPVVLRKGREVKALLRIKESAVGKETVEVRLAGAGVSIRKRYMPGKLDRPVSLRFRPTRAGVVRYWVVMQPYGVTSLVYGLRVR